MLIEFSVGNYKSFKEIQTIHFQAAKIKSKYASVDEQNVFAANQKYDLLKSKVVYGANASGKSNLVSAMRAFARIIQGSFKDARLVLGLSNPFVLSELSEDTPTFFQASFIISGIFYRYGFQVKQGVITDEWLFGRPEKVEVYYFKREGQEVTINEARMNDMAVFKEQKTSPLYPETSLVLTVASALNRDLCAKITDYFENKFLTISGLRNPRLASIAFDQMNDPNFANQVTSLLQSIDNGIVSMETINREIENFELKVNGVVDKRNAELFQAMKGEKLRAIYTNRNKYNEKNEVVGQTSIDLILQEAEGTKKIFELAAPLFVVLRDGGLLVIDEFDARLHPRLSRKIIELFNSKATNPKNAQLLVISHDTNLMDAKLLRRDQICFVEKDKYGASSVYSLVEYKGIRNNASFEADYLKGKYGAVPFLNEMDNLFMSIND